MKILRNLLVIIGCMTVASTAYAYAHPRIPAQAQRARYALQTDLWSYPYTLKLRHCAPSEDTLATLRMVDYRPADSIVIYRCVKP